MFCFLCLNCQVAGDMDECCLCGSSVAMRTLYRTKYNIPVSDQLRARPNSGNSHGMGAGVGAQGRRKGCPRGRAEAGSCMGIPAGRESGTYLSHHCELEIIPPQTTSSQSLLNMINSVLQGPGELPRGADDTKQKG